MAGTVNRLMQSYQGRVPPITTGAAARYDLSGWEYVPAEYQGGDIWGPQLEQAGGTWWGPFSESGKLPPFEDRFADFPEPLRWRMICCCRATMEQCLRDVTAEIRGLTASVAVPEDIYLYYSVLDAARIAGVDAEEARRHLYAFLATIE